MRNIDTAAVRASAPISLVVGQSVQLRRQGGQLVGNCPFHPDRTPSLSVSDEKGKFYCFGCGECGDVIDFVMKRDGLSFLEAVEAIEGGAYRRHSTSRTPSCQRRRPDMQQAAQSIWRSTLPLNGTVAELYLRHRGLPLAELPSLPALGFGRLAYKGSEQRHPTLVSALTAPDGEVTAIQRTYLTEKGLKLDVAEPKLSLGPSYGGAIRLGETTSELIVCEGLEDGLSLLRDVSDVSVWVAAGAGKMARMWLPEECRIVTIAADNDEAGKRAADEAAVAFQQLGKRTRVMRPSPQFKDFNQQLLARLA